MYGCELWSLDESRVNNFCIAWGKGLRRICSVPYLGSDIDSDSYSCPEIHRRLGIAGSIIAQLDNVWRQQKLSLSTKLRIYTSLVQSVVLYGSETWTMRKVVSDRIQSFHMQALRRILGIRWYDKVSNTVVNERTKLPDVIHYLVTSVAYRRTHLLRRHYNCQ